MKMRQIDIYKKALRVLEKARVSTSRRGYVYWTAETFHFAGLCKLLYDISLSSDKVTAWFKRDSEIVLGRELDEDDLWFTDMEDDEPKARAERLEHLEKLIKLYEDDTARDI